MTSSLTRFVRPAAALIAVLLVGGAVQVGPAEAAPRRWGGGVLTMWTRAVYPYDEAPGYWGDTPAQPADARLAPGSVTFDVHVQNDGEAVHGITVAPRVVTNGHVDGIHCSTTPLPDDVLVPGDTAGSSGQRESAHRSSPLVTAPTWSDPALVLPTGEHLYCTVAVSGITDTVLSEVVTTATAVGVGSGRKASGDDGGVWAAAGSLRPPPPPPGSIGQGAWVDKNDDGGWLRSFGPPYEEWDEPGIPGLHLTITGPDGKPVPSYPTGQGVVGPLTTDKDGRYRFDHLRPYVNPYTVTVDLDSPALAGLMKSRSAPGTVSPDHSTWSQKVHLTSGDDGSVNFRFVPTNMLKLTIDTRWTAVAGSTMTFSGHAEKADGSAWDGPVVLESRLGGTSTWTKVADATSHQGTLAAKGTATRSADFRFRSPGDHDTAPAATLDFHVVVTRAPVALTASAPAAVRQGAPVTVTGTVRRAGQAFRTSRIVLEHSPDASTWTTVAEVRSADGTLSATVQPTRSGSYRYRYLGDSRTAPGTSPPRAVAVEPSASTSPSVRPHR